MTTATAASIPPFVDLERDNHWGYEPKQLEFMESAQEWGKQRGVRPASTDKRNVHLLIIDAQNDFCYPEGTLYVAGRSGTGAKDDNRRLAEFIYREMGNITRITCTMDTHFAFQIFFAAFWVDKDNKTLKPFRTISVDDVMSGRVRPNPRMAKWLCKDVAWMNSQAEYYVKQLAAGNKYELYLWPQHCLLGNVGHALAGIIQQARYVQAYARDMQTWTQPKGGCRFSENYSVLAPEVLGRWDGKGALEQRNTEFFEDLRTSDALVIGGQAASHCVKNTIDDLLTLLEPTPQLLERVYILDDCMSAVVVPGGPDYTDEAAAALKRFSDAGMHVVQSTTPMESWPGFPQK